MCVFVCVDDVFQPVSHTHEYPYPLKLHLLCIPTGLYLLFNPPVCRSALRGIPNLVFQKGINSKLKLFLKPFVVSAASPSVCSRRRRLGRLGCCSVGLIVTVVLKSGEIHLN